MPGSVSVTVDSENPMVPLRETGNVNLKIESENVSNQHENAGNSRENPTKKTSARGVSRAINNIGTNLLIANFERTNAITESDFNDPETARLVLILAKSNLKKQVELIRELKNRHRYLNKKIKFLRDVMKKCKQEKVKKPAEVKENITVLINLKE